MYCGITLRWFALLQCPNAQAELSSIHYSSDMPAGILQEHFDEVLHEHEHSIESTFQ